MPIAQRTLVVAGLADMQKAWAVADRETSKELREALKDAARPVAVDAQTFALGRIRNVGQPWSRMRVGVTRRSVYVAPKQRETRVKRRKRPNLADLLAGRAMQPALNRNIGRVEANVEEALATVGRKWEQA